MKKNVKHHGFAHLVLIIVLFLVAYLVFGAGKLSASLSLGAAIFSLVQSGSAGQVSVVGALAGSTLQLIIIFIINLIVYYTLAAILIFLYNLMFGKKE